MMTLTAARGGDLKGLVKYKLCLIRCASTGNTFVLKKLGELKLWIRRLAVPSSMSDSACKSSLTSSGPNAGRGPMQDTTLKWHANPKKRNTLLNAIAGRR